MLNEYDWKNEPYSIVFSFDSSGIVNVTNCEHELNEPVHIVSTLFDRTTSLIDVNWNEYDPISVTVSGKVKLATFEQLNKKYDGIFVIFAGAKILTVVSFSQLQNAKSSMDVHDCGILTVLSDVHSSKHDDPIVEMDSPKSILTMFVQFLNAPVPNGIILLFGFEKRSSVMPVQFWKAFCSIFWRLFPKTTVVNETQLANAESRISTTESGNSNVFSDVQP